MATPRSTNMLMLGLIMIGMWCGYYGVLKSNGVSTNVAFIASIPATAAGIAAAGFGSALSKSKKS